MKLDAVKVGLFVFAVALSSTSYTYAAPSLWTSEFSDYDLDGFSELDVASDNYAEVNLTNTSSSRVVINQKQVGFNGNKAKVMLVRAMGSDVYLLQLGAGNIASIEQRDGINEARVVQVGYGHESYIVQEGNLNQADIAQYGAYSDVNLVQLGGSNYTKITDFRGSNYDIKQNGGATIEIESSMKRNISIEQ